MAKKKPLFDLTNIGIIRQIEMFERLANPLGKVIRQAEMIGRLANPLGDVIERTNRSFGATPHAFTNHMKLAQDMSGLSAVFRDMKLIQGIYGPLGGISGFNPLSNQMKLAQDMSNIARGLPANTKWTDYSAMAQADNISAAAAALHARGFITNVGLDRLTSVIDSVASTILGQTINNVARAFPSQSLIASEALSALAGLKLQPEFAHDGTLVSYLATLQDAIDKSESETDLLHFLLEAAQIIQRQLEELLQVSKSKIGVATFITLVLTALCVYYARIQAHNAEVQTHYAELAEQRAQQQDETNKQLNDTLSKIDELLSQALSAKQDAHVDTKCFRVDRAVNVRERQDTTSFRITLLQPGSIIEVAEYNRYWARVTIDDHITGVTRDGWVWKKNISRCH